MILGTELIAPATASGGSAVFDVDAHSKVIYIAPSTGTTLTEDDSFSLARIVDEAGRAIPCVELAGAVTLGANRTSFEIIERGSYKLSKSGVTTELVGAYQLSGFEEVK